MIAFRSRLRAVMYLVVSALCCVSQAVSQNDINVGTIPNECCPVPSALFFDDGYYADVRDAGLGLSSVPKSLRS